MCLFCILRTAVDILTLANSAVIFRESLFLPLLRLPLLLLLLLLLLLGWGGFPPFPGKLCLFSGLFSFCSQRVCKAGVGAGRGMLLVWRCGQTRLSAGITKPSGLPNLRDPGAGIVLAIAFLLRPGKTCACMRVSTDAQHELQHFKARVLCYLDAPRG